MVASILKKNAEETGSKGVYANIDGDSNGTQDALDEAVQKLISEKMKQTVFSVNENAPPSKTRNGWPVNVDEENVGHFLAQRS